MTEAAHQDAPPPIGHNNPPEPTEFEKFNAKLKDWAEAADVWAARGELDDELAPRARDFIDGVKKFARLADAARDAEKRPYLEAGRAIDARWKGLIDAAAKIAKTVEPKLLAYMKKQKAIADAKAAEAAKAAREAEEAKKRAELDAAQAMTASARIDAERRAAEAAAQQKAAERAASNGKVAVASATGLAKNAGLRTVRRARIDEPMRTLLHYARHSEVLALIERLANADIRAAKGAEIEIPGVTVIETQELAA